MHTSVLQLNLVAGNGIRNRIGILCSSPVQRSLAKRRSQNLNALLHFAFKSHIRKLGLAASNPLFSASLRLPKFLVDVSILSAR